MARDKSLRLPGIDYSARAEEEERGMRPEPSPHDSLGLIEAARRNWEADPSLRVEFGDDFARYAAFYRADKKGLVKILGRGRSA